MPERNRVNDVESGDAEKKQGVDGVATKRFWEHLPDWIKLLFGAVGLITTLVTFYVSTRTDIGALKGGLARIEQSLVTTSAKNDQLQRELVKRVIALESQSRLQQMLIGSLEGLRKSLEAQQSRINELRIEQVQLRTRMDSMNARPMGK